VRFCCLLTCAHVVLLSPFILLTGFLHVPYALLAAALLWCLLLHLHTCARREEPAVRVRDDPPLDIVSIDNLPSVLALEASHAFAELLLPALMAYPQDKGWAEAKKVRVCVLLVMWVWVGWGRGQK
jgi:hypothetical protein